MTNCYSPIPETQLSPKRSASRTYRRSTATDRWPVWRMIDASVFPALTAAVMSPARSECPE